MGLSNVRLGWRQWVSSCLLARLSISAGRQRRVQNTANIVRPQVFRPQAPSAVRSVLPLASTPLPSQCCRSPVMARVQPLYDLCTLARGRDCGDKTGAPPKRVQGLWSSIDLDTAGLLTAR
jgi:hypothetical protein